MENGFELTDVQINRKCVFDVTKESSATATLRSLSLVIITLLM